MKNNIFIIGIFLMIVFLGSAKNTLAACGAGWFCGIDAGYKISVNSSGKRCTTVGSSYVCSNDGTWVGNGDYDCISGFTDYGQLTLTMATLDCSVIINGIGGQQTYYWPNVGGGTDYYSCTANGGVSCKVDTPSYQTTCCVEESSCPAEETCPSSCGYEGGTVADGACGDKVCGATAPCCNPSNPAAPVISSPTNGTQIYVNNPTTVDWNDVAWGVGCPDSKKYVACFSSNNVDCDDVNLIGSELGETSYYDWTPSVADPSVYLYVGSVNAGSGEIWSSPVITVCVEGFNINDTNYVSDWTTSYVSEWTASCGSQTRTCTETCGSDDCAGVTTTRCNECGPHGSQSCGNWTQTYDCKAPVSGCKECVTCAAPYCGQARNCSAACSSSDIGNCSAPYCGQLDPCGNACSNADNGAPNTPTCTSLGNVVGTPQTINWTSGGIPPADNWFYSLNGGGSVSDSDLSASVAVNCGSNSWQALARNTTCGNDDSGWCTAGTLCRQCAPTTPTCTSIAASTDSTPTINWSSGGATADTWFYKIDGGSSVAAAGLTASPAVTCGSHTWTAMARDNTCGDADSGWTAPASACSLCYQCAPDAPTLVGPANGAQVRVGQVTSLSWAGTGWGTGCPNVNNYQVCVMSGATCDLVNWVNDPDTASPYGGWTPAAADPSVTWKIRVNNGSLTAESTTRTVCVEGGAVLSNWSTCNASHKRTRTCSETCGVDDCALETLIEDCTGIISGVLFDGSDYVSCPGDLITNPSAYGGVLIANQDFLMTSPFNLPSWPPNDNGNPKTLTTNLNGFYSVTGFSPGDYSYDFSALEDVYTGVDNPKLKCTASMATLLGSDTTCATMPCPPPSENNSFGFWRVYGGWWQVTGGSVYAKSGVQSYVPASVPPISPLVTTNQRLILPDANGRYGMLSYGAAWGGAELGTNPDVRVSDKLWRIQSLYDGQRYDYNYFNTRMDVFDSTAWDGGVINYTDVDNGYQIFKRTGNVTLNYSGPTGTQKVILLVDGSVTINNDVTVSVGAFLGVIAKGSITFGSTVANAEGWFVAENISVPCKDIDVAPLGTCDADDVQFVGEGSFVGWTGIDLKRDRDVTNNTAPSEKFTYRPDMFNNAPTPMKVYTKAFSPFIP